MIKNNTLIQGEELSPIATWYAMLTRIESLFPSEQKQRSRWGREGKLCPGCKINK